MSPWRAFLRDGIMAFSYALEAVLLTAPLIFRLADALPQELGDPLLNTWILAWETRALTERPGAFFDAPIFYPHRGTLAYSEPLLGILPFAFPFILGTGIPALGYNIAFLASFWVAALGMARLVRAWGGSRRAAFLAGWLFAGAPYRFAHLMHLQLLYMGWIPLAMAALLRYRRRPTGRRALDLLLSLLLMTLSTWHLAVFGGIILILLGFWSLREKSLSRPAAGQLGLVLLVWGLVTGGVAIPYLRVAPELARHRDLRLAQEFSAWPIDGLAAAPTLRILGLLTAPFRIPGHTTHEVQLYPGLAPLLMAAWAWRGRREEPVRAVWRTAWMGIGLGALMALGPRWDIGSISVPGLYAGLVALFPAVTLIRAVARWFLLTLIGLHALGGIGLEKALSSARRRMPLALGILSLGTLEAWAVPLPLAPLPRLSALPPAYYWLAQQPGEFAIVELPVFLPLDDAETLRMYAALVHRKPLVIAYSGYIPPDIRRLRERLRSFPSYETWDTLAALRSIGVRYVLIDSRWPESQAFYTSGICQIGRDPRFHPVARLGPHWIFALRDPSLEQVDGPPQMYEVDVPFGEAARLRSYGIRWRSPDELEVWLSWEAGPHPHGNYIITVHALDEHGHTLAQYDEMPKNGGYPFHCWQPGEQILEQRVLSAQRLREAQSLGVGIYEWPSLQHLPAPRGTKRIGELVLLPLSKRP
ncbi:hypothetical protein [Thermoflexus hugenholtzii]